MLLDIMRSVEAACAMPWNEAKMLCMLRVENKVKVEVTPTEISTVAYF
jgi:hypothetical protein